MGEMRNQQLLRLVDDPAARILGMLGQMPVETAVVYLEMICDRAGQLGLLSDADHERVAALLGQIGHHNVDRAA